MDNRKGKTSVQVLSALLLFVAFLLGISSSAWALTWIDDFNTPLSQLHGIRTGGSEGEHWTLTGLTYSNRHTADATNRAGRISPGTPAKYTTTTVTDGNWGTADNFIGLYIWGNGDPNQKFSIKIIEEDLDGPLGPPPAMARDETWILDTDAVTPGNQPQVLNWTGWKYKMYKLGGAGSDFTHSGGDGIWNPVYTPLNFPQNFEIRGAKEIDLTLTGGSENVYIDEITLSDSGTKTGWVTQVFPTDDVSDTGIDITLDRLPPTISAVLGPSADVTSLKTNIYVIRENPFEGFPWGNSYPTSDLINGINNDVRADGVHGLFATPNDSTYQPGNVFTVFIRPANSIGEFGQAQVITFKVSLPSAVSKKVGTKYNRNVTK